MGCLDECACAWEIFTSGEIHYFFAPNKHWDMNSTQNHRMVAITSSFNQMAKLKRKLDTVNAGLKNTMNEVSLCGRSATLVFMHPINSL